MPAEFPDIDDNNDESQSERPTLKFERRTIDRWPAAGSATAVCVGGERFGESYELKLSDASLDGLGALCDSALEPGTMVSVGFHNSSMNAARFPGGYRQAVVLRCLPCGTGYRVGLQFALRAAA